MDTIRRHQSLQIETGKYGRIHARIPAGIEQTCRHLAASEGWELGDLYRGLIILGACGSFLTLRSLEPDELRLGIRFQTMVKQFLGKRAYAPRTGKASRVVTVSLPNGVIQSLNLYSELTGRLRSHAYARFLQAGLLVYIESKRRLLGGEVSEE